MQEKIKKIPQQILEFWRNFTSKQKTVIISIFSAVVVAIIFFVVMFTRVTYEQVAVYSDASDTAAAKTILEEENIKYKVADDGVTLSVDSKHVADAKMALGKNSVGVDTKSTYTYDKAFDNSMSTTSKEKDEKFKIAFQNGLADTIKQTITGVEEATVQVTFADDNTSILENEKVDTCAAVLTINDDFKKKNAKGIAQYLATSIGSTNTDNVKIIDQDGNILFSGADNNGGSASISSAADYSDKVTNDIKTQVQALLLKSSNYNDVEVAPNMEIDFDKSTVQDELYYTPDGAETGPKSYDYSYENKNNSDGGKVVGTDANDGEATDYNLSNGAESSGTTTIYKNEYNTSKRTTVTEAGNAQIDYDKSSLAIVLNKYHTYYEDDLKEELDKNKLSFSEFKQQKADSIPLDVDPTLLTSVSKATGIAEDNISIMAYEVPVFYDSAKVSTADMIKKYLPYVLALIIVALLLFVVLKGMKPVEVTEMEPELSVEALLATTKENQSLDDIEFSDKSATREQIEKFVDENPEAVAQLLRNWLNEDWE